MLKPGLSKMREEWQVEEEANDLIMPGVDKLGSKQNNKKTTNTISNLVF